MVALVRYLNQPNTKYIKVLEGIKFINQLCTLNRDVFF